MTKFRRYVFELGVALAAYIICLVLSLRLLSLGGQSELMRLVITLLPMLPGLVICWVVLRGLRRLDELARKIQLEAIGVAFAGTALVTFSYGFLENIGLPSLSMFVVWPLMASLWFVGTIIGQLRYR
ncbi:hypothetical protein [Phyllobacterium sp. SB3]|uniref:hypothetical protein n=1 Tax=Phyllobacterium sp. SB3 TaxID=3156073 RepID=UPI0032AF202B